MVDDNSDEIEGHPLNQSHNRRECSDLLSCTEQTRNVLQLGIGFFFIFLALNSQGFIEEAVLDSFARKGIGVKFHDGYTSLAIIYASFTIHNFVAAPIIAWLGVRWALVFAGLTYAIFQAGFLFVNRWYLFSSSTLLGLGAAVIWTAQGKYLAMNSTEETAGRHSGLFWALSQLCQSCGGIFLLVVFLLMPSPPGGGEQETSISVPTVRFIYGTFTALTVLGTVILALLPVPTATTPARQTNTIDSTSSAAAVRDPSTVSTELAHSTDEGAEGSGEAEAIAEQPSHLAILSSTVKLMGTRRMVFFSLPFMYTGISQSFWSSIYPTTVANTEMFQLNQGVNPKLLLALTAIVQGIGQATSGFIFGILDSRTRHFGRTKIVSFGAALQLCSFLLAYLNLPAHAPLEKTFEHGILNSPSITLALIGGFLLSFGDACWNTQIFATLIAKYPIRVSQAFAVFKFFQSLLCCAAFFYATSISLPWHVLILAIGLFVGLIGFLLAERMVRQNDDDFGNVVIPTHFEDGN
ncbi:hypothetical protein niasHT_037172 [Heterodera trifolii]|uniref:UNC93-like protein MFSD11 n=1 Tax=Heterodera trifolii TaxID=157864 RepID=A0ABD2ICW7_9BILA